MGEGEGWVSTDPQKKLTEKNRIFYGKWGGSLTQSIKSLTERVKENPYWGEGVKKIRSFSIFHQFLTCDCSPNFQDHFSLKKKKMCEEHVIKC